MRSITPQLAAALAAESTTLCRLWRVTRRDGTVLAFTDSVLPVTFAGRVYRADISFTASAILLSASSSSQQSVTINVITDPLGLTEADLRARLYDGAVGDVFIVDYTHPEYGGLPVFSGIVGPVKISDKRSCSIELLPRGTGGTGRAIATDVYSATCRNQLGDTGCTVNIAALSRPFTVASSVGGVVNTVERGEANGAWALGYIVWTSGANVGQTQQVQTNDSAGKVLFLVSLPLTAIQPGDTGTVFPGCDKLITTCRDKFNNVANNDSEPFVPPRTVGRSPASDMAVFSG